MKTVLAAILLIVTSTNVYGADIQTNNKSTPNLKRGMKIVTMSTSKFFIPTKKTDDWKLLLADQNHWKIGYSAQELAYSWQEANDFPVDVKRVFKKSQAKIFKDIQLLLAFPEYRVLLHGGGRSSQNDIFILAKGNNELVSIMVEGKKSEEFGETVAKWKSKNDTKTNKVKRLDFLLKKLNLKDALIDHVRYQLLHRTASAIIEAEKFNTKNALMLIHSFSQSYEHFEDYLQFLSLFGLSGKKDTLTDPVNIEGIKLYFGWVKGKLKSK